MSDGDFDPSNIPRDSITVCGKTYRCQSTANGDAFWSTEGDVGHGSRECKVDILAAAAHANNCNAPSSVPADCLRKNAILRKQDGTTVQVRDASTHDMPSVMDADWKCVAKGIVNKDTHEPSHMEDYGGVALLRLSPKSSSSSSSDQVATPVASDDEALRRAWKTCSLSTREQKRACSVDSDCPIMDSKLNEMLLAKTRELNIDMSRGLSRFVKTLQNTLSPDLEWTPTRVHALEDVSKTTSGVKSSIGTLLNTDPAFRDSVRAIVEKDPDFSTLRERARSGSCTTQGKCMSSTVVPTSRIYDGTNNVTFSVLEDRVMYARNGVVREAEAVRCSGARKEECNKITEVLEGRDSISLTGRGVAPVYRLRFAGVDSEYIVMNNVNVRNEDECAARLCEHNAGSCPSSICSLTDDGVCIQKMDVPTSR